MGDNSSSEAKLLCPNCRLLGHSMANCPKPLSYDEESWFFSAERKAMKAVTRPYEQPCSRCQNLKIPELLRTPGSEYGFDNFDQLRSESAQKFRSLGLVGTVRFSDDCPVCRCLFRIMPTPFHSSQEVLLFTSLAADRLNTRDAGGLYSKVLLAVLWPSLQRVSKGDGPRTDALCIMENDGGDHQNGETGAVNGRRATPLGGRKMNSQKYSLDTLKEWLARCDRLHPTTCQPVYAEELKQISLLDVHERRIVRYPGGNCEYVALSYVWGGIVQDPVQRGSTLGKLPQTIEDAITFVKELGKQYLWVDSVCINQAQEDEKQRQIGRMCAIYQGAYATIVAVSGDSAEAGLARLNPQIATHDQFSCVINGETLVTVGPTLSQTIWVTNWGTRAWTFQEALLSRRCFYFADHQVWFECNAMTCCESLDESKSPIHDLYWDTRFVEEEHPEEKYGRGTLRNPFVGQSRRPERLKEYGGLLILYKYREMTNDSDSINAFAGLLTALTQNFYPSGFIWGLPIQHFNFGLMWAPQGEARRRADFPSWSWAGWDAPIWPHVPDDGTVERDVPIQPLLKIWRFRDGLQEQFFETDPEVPSDSTATEDPITKSNLKFEAGSVLDDLDYAGAERKGLIYIEGIILRFQPNKSVGPGNERGGDSVRTSTTLQGREFLLCYTKSGQKLDDQLGSTHDFLLLARYTTDDAICYRLLMVGRDPDAKVWSRIAPMTLFILKKDVGVIRDAVPTVRRILLG